MTRITTKDATRAMRDQIRDSAERAADGNTLVSHKEARDLDPFLKRSEEALRAEGGPGTRVKVNALVERASADASLGWEKFNPAGHGVDSAFLSRAERAEIAQDDPQLGALTDLAMLRLGKLPPADQTAAVRDFFADFDFSDHRLSEGSLLGGARVDARPGRPERAQLPQSVLEVFDFYHRAEDADWASVSLQSGTIAGQPVWVSYMTTDGDDEYLEIMDAQGKALASGHLLAGDDLRWDAWPGRVRLANDLAELSQPRHDEGLSETVEAVAAGQIPPRGWPGEVTIDSGFLYPKDKKLDAIDLPPELQPELRDAATAAFNYLWDAHFVYQDPTAPIELGARHAGTMTLGHFTRPDDGQSYLVANWRDVDDASYTFYFKPGPAAPTLSIVQYNN